MPLSSPEPRRPASPGRRTLLLGAGLAALAGCTRLTDPVVHGSHSLSPEPVPTPDALFVTASTEVAAHRAKVVALSPAPARAWAAAATAMLDAHLRVLTAREPLSGQPSPQPWITPSPAAPGRVDAAALAASAEALSAAHQARCLQATSADLAMLWGALAVATRLAPGPAQPAPRAGGLPLAVRVGDEVAARNVLLGHLHALVQVLELGVGEASGSERDPFVARLAAARTLVVDQQREVRGLGGDPAGPLPGYRWPGPVGSPAEVTRTWALVEDRVLTAHGPVVGASAPDRRAAALAAMIAQGEQVRRRGLGTTYFPGWS